MLISLPRDPSTQWLAGASFIGYLFGVTMFCLICAVVLEYVVSVVEYFMWRRKQNLKAKKESQDECPAPFASTTSLGPQ